jgi:pimeloyl-ACP methyl ester carboxylesterase
MTEHPATASFTASDGTEIVYDTWGGGRPGVPIVLHHGFAASAEANWTGPGVTGKLLALGRPIVALDARGHGRSDKPHDPAAYAGGAMVGDVRTLIDHLGIASIDLVGYSMGAHVSLGVATEENRLRSVVLGGIGGATVTGAPFDRSEVADGLVAEDPRTITDVRARGFRRFADSTNADRHALAAVMRADRLPPTGLDRITVPCLVVVGREDDLAADVQGLVDAVPRATLVTVPGDHLGAVGEPAFAQALLDFLSAVERDAT